MTLAAVIQTFKDWQSFHINHFEVKEFNERGENGAFKLASSSSDRIVLKFIHHAATDELYAVVGTDKDIPDMRDIVKRNVIVGLAMGFSNWYFWGLGMKDAGFCLYHIAKSAQTIWQAYKNPNYDRTHFINVEIPQSLHPAFHYGVHAVKNFGMAAVLEMTFPTILTYNIIVGQGAALYGVRNPLNFRTLFTRFENWWTADVQPIKQNDVKGLTKVDQVKAFVDMRLKLHQILFPEPIRAVDNPVVGQEGEKKYVPVEAQEKKRQ